MDKCGACGTEIKVNKKVDFPIYMCDKCLEKEYKKLWAGMGLEWVE